MNHQSVHYDEDSTHVLQSLHYGKIPSSKLSLMQKTEKIKPKNNKTMKGSRILFTQSELYTQVCKGQYRPIAEFVYNEYYTLMDYALNEFRSSLKEHRNRVRKF